MFKSIPIAVLITGAITLALLLGALASGGAGSLHSFISVEGLLIVVGGTIVNAFLSFHREDVLRAFATIRHIFDEAPVTRDGLHRDIMQIIKWSYVMQAEGMLGLDRVTSRTVNDPLMRYGMDLVLTGYSASRIRKMMQTLADAEFERRCMPVTVLRNMAATAPAFGMVGTLIGMVMLLGNVGTDISNIGGGLAIAMLATLYGILSARLICLPAADKLLLKEEHRHFRSLMMGEGFALLAEKQKPFYVQDKLNSFLEPARHIEYQTHAHLAAHRNRQLEVA